MLDLPKALLAHRPLVVGAINHQATLAQRFGPEDCDLVELRLDALGTGAEVRQFAERQRENTPLVLTARHPAEGGENNLSTGERAASLEAFSDLGAMIDVEARSLEELEDTWTLAGALGLIRVASYHNFDHCPPIDELVECLHKMLEAGANVAKFAIRVVEPGELHTLVGLLRVGAPLPLAIMGMGPLAPASRLLAAQFGSVLNYGYLGESPTAPGQWPARLLKEAMEHTEQL